MTIIHIEKMVADNTIWLDTPICGCKKIRVIKCFFENKLINLPRDGTISRTTKGTSPLLTIPAGNYNLTQIKEKINIIANASRFSISNENKFIPQFDVVLNKPLAKLLGLDTSLKQNIKNKIIIAENPNAFYLQCSVVDRNQVMVGDNGKHLPILTFFPIKFPKNSIYSYVSGTYLSTGNCEYINHIQFRVTDVNNNLIEDGIYPMHLSIEII